MKIASVMSGNFADGYYEFSREDLEIDTSITTVYFVQNGNNDYELQPTATGTPLHVVKKSNGNNMESNCNVYKLYVMTSDGLMEINKDGFLLVTANGRRYVQVMIHIPCTRQLLYHISHTIYTEYCNDKLVIT